MRGCSPPFGPTVPVARGLRRRQIRVLCRVPCVASQSASRQTEHAEPRLGLDNETSPGSDNAGLEQDRVGLEQDEVGFEQDEVGLEQGKVGLEQDEVGLEQDEVGLEQDEVGLEQDKVGLEQDEFRHWTTGWTSRCLDNGARPGQNHTIAGRLG